MKVTFVYENKDLKISNEKRIGRWLEEVVRSEGKSLGQISVNFVSEKVENQINKKFLNHNYPTDIITFDKSFLNKISGDLYIAHEVVKRNAADHSSGIYEKELHRVIVHGILHLLGYNDKTEQERIRMRSLEDKHLSYLESF